MSMEAKVLKLTDVLEDADFISDMALWSNLSIPGQFRWHNNYDTGAVLDEENVTLKATLNNSTVICI